MALCIYVIHDNARKPILNFQLIEIQTKKHKSVYTQTLVIICEQDQRFTSWGEI